MYPRETRHPHERFYRLKGGYSDALQKILANDSVAIQYISSVWDTSEWSESIRLSGSIWRRDGVGGNGCAPETKRRVSSASGSIALALTSNRMFYEKKCCERCVEKRTYLSSCCFWDTVSMRSLWDSNFKKCEGSTLKRKKHMKTGYLKTQYFKNTLFFKVNCTQ